MDGSCLVNQLLQLCGQDRDRTAFDSLHPPVLNAYEYMDRHRLLGVSIVLAQKFDEDVPHSTVAYARVVGVVPKELNKLQRLFLQEIDYRLTYPPWFNMPSA